MRISNWEGATNRVRQQERDAIRDNKWETDREREKESERETATQDEINKGQSVKMSDDQTVAAQNDDKGKWAPTKWAMQHASYHTAPYTLPI